MILQHSSKTLVVLAGYAPSLVNFRLHLLLELQKQGYHVIACAPQKVDWVIKTLIEHNIEFNTFPISPASIAPHKDVLFLLKFSHFLKRIKPNIFFAYTIKPVIYGSLAAKLAGVPQIYSFITGLGYTFEDRTFKQKVIGKISKTLYSIALRLNNMVFFQNQDDVQVFKEKKILNHNASITITNGSGVDLKHFQFEPYFHKNPVFLLIARFLKSKGILEYIEAAQIVKQKYPQAEFHLVGYFYDSPDTIDRKYIEEAHQKGIIIYQGETNDVRPFIKNCSVYVLPSYREGTPRSVLEAMAIGRPIITTDVPGCKETVINGVNGFLVPAKDVNSLAQAMFSFIENPGLISKMGKQSRLIAEQKYDVHKVNATILSGMGIE